jgi:hypothetical protein
VKHSVNALAVCALAALLAPAAASGQGIAISPALLSTAQAPSDRPQPEQVRRPFRGLFGAPADPRGKQSLTVTFSAFAAYDDDLLAAETGTSSPTSTAQRSGWYPGATAGLAYTRRGDRVSGDLQGDAGVNHYPSLDRTTTMYRAGGSLTARVARRTTLGVAADEVYAPQYRLGLFTNPNTLTGEADPFSTVATDLDLFRSNAYRTSAQATLSQELGRRTTLDAYYAFGDVNYVDNEFDYASRAAGIRLSQRLTQHLGFHAGYGYSTASYDRPQDGARQRIHNIDLGVDYGRALSVSRRTTFTFSTGSSAITQGERLTGAPGSGFRYHLIGTANLRHEIGRTFSASIGYRRSVDFHEGFNDPFLSDAVTASYDGLLTRRLGFNARADYALGSVGLGGDNNGYDSASASAGLEYALSRTLALYGRYVYYRYHFDSGVALDPRFVPSLDRQGVRVGLSASFPILR